MARDGNADGDPDGIEPTEPGICNVCSEQWHDINPELIFIRTDSKISGIFDIPD